MTVSPQANETLPSLIGAARYRWPTILTGVVIGALLGFVYSSVSGSSYTSTSRVLLFPAPGNPLTPEAASASGTQLTIAMETESGIVRTPEVAAIAGAEAGRNLPGGGEQLRVRVPGGTQVVEVKFTSDTPERAAQGSQAFSEAFLDFRAEQATSSQDRLLDNLRGQAEAADANLRRASVDALDSEGSTFAVQEVELFTDRLTQLNERISGAEAVSTAPGRVINPAELPNSRNEVPPLLLIVAGLVAGLIIGVVWALFREWRRDVVREGEQTEIAGVAVFASLPANKPGILSQDNEPLGYEAYRRLLAAVVANGPRPHTLAVAAVDPDALITDVVANLAAGLASAQFSVLVVAADADDRGIERVLGVPSAPGLSEVVHDRVDARSILTLSDGVMVLPGGAKPGSVRELYAGPAFRRVVDSFRSDYDYVILAASNAGTGDGDAVIAVADSVLLTVSSGRSTHGQVTAALDRLGRLGIEAMGAVLTPAIGDPVANRRGETVGSGGSQRIAGAIESMWPRADITIQRAPALTSRELTYAMIPSRANPSRLVPIRPRRVLRSAIRAHGPPTARGDRLKARVLSAVAGLGGGMFLPNTVRIRQSDVGRQSSLVAHLGDQLGHDVIAGIYLGPPRANRKPVLQLMKASGETVAFVKVGINPLTRDRVRHEALALESLARLSFDTLRCPEVLGAQTWRDCEYLVLSPLVTGSAGSVDDTIRTTAMRELAGAFGISEIRWSAGTWWTEWVGPLGAIAAGSSDRDSETADDAAVLQSFADRLESSCGHRSLLVGAAHGDWTPWNMTTVRGQAHVWDWERFELDVPVGWDALHYEFQSEIRLGGLTARQALTAVAADSQRIVGLNGARSEDGPLLMALYALRLGSRFVIDDQRRAGVRKGPLSQWLLPELEQLVVRAERAPVDVT